MILMNAEGGTRQAELTLSVNANREWLLWRSAAGPRPQRVEREPRPEVSPRDERIGSWSRCALIPER
jgi:hypothetical protein